MPDGQQYIEAVHYMWIHLENGRFNCGDSQAVQIHVRRALVVDIATVIQHAWERHNRGRRSK